MAANSVLRRGIKTLLHPVLNERYYRFLQAIAVAWDIIRGSYPEPELSLVPIAVTEGDTALDIGANYGFYTYHLDRAVGKTGIVYAFEPVPFTKDVLDLVSKILRFRKVQIYEKGCSDQGGRISFQIPLQSSGAMSAGLAFMCPRNNQQFRGGILGKPNTRSIPCDVVAIDHFLPSLSELSFIKCDIEGSELLAFRGAEATIMRHHPTVLCEINHRFLRRANICPTDLTYFFLSKGYKIYQYANRSRLTEVSSLENNAEGNYIFIHPTRAGRFANLFE